jgi:hypothetical protein
VPDPKYRLWERNIARRLPAWRRLPQVLTKAAAEKAVDNAHVVTCDPNLEYVALPDGERPDRVPEQ